MHYFLNGGRDERSVVKSPAARALYESLHVQRILFIPLAIVENYWQELWHNKQDLFSMSGFEVQALTTLDTASPTIQQKIAWADMIYFPGGVPVTLLKRLRQSGADDAIKLAIESDSLKLLAGGSAGAMVMGTDCINGHTEVKTVVPGLAFLPGFIIDSHFSNRHREPRLLQLLAERPQLTGIGIDEDTAIVLGPDFALQAVYGPGTVKVYHHTNTEIYDSNSRFTP